MIRLISLFYVQLTALVAKTTNLQKIPFAWHIMPSEDYERQVKAKGDMKRFDFMHMIQVFMTLHCGHSINVMTRRFLGFNLTELQ